MSFSTLWCRSWPESSNSWSPNSIFLLIQHIQLFNPSFDLSLSFCLRVQFPLPGMLFFPPAHLGKITTFFGKPCQLLHFTLLSVSCSINVRAGCLKADSQICVYRFVRKSQGKLGKVVGWGWKAGRGGSQVSVKSQNCTVGAFCLIHRPTILTL